MVKIYMQMENYNLLGSLIGSMCTKIREYGLRGNQFCLGEQVKHQSVNDF